MTTICPHCGYDLRGEEPVQDGKWLFEPRRGIFFEGRHVRLGPSRTLLMAALMRAKGRVLTKDALLGVIGGEDSTSNYLAQQVSLTRGILLNAGLPNPIENVWGQGFRWDGAGDHPGHRIPVLAGSIAHGSDHDALPTGGAAA